MEQMANVYLFGKKYVVPASLTIMEAMEYCGYRLVRGCGCRNGFCGACATIYRIAGDRELKACLACSTKVEDNMYVATLPFFPLVKEVYNIEEIKPTQQIMMQLYPEIYSCVGCNACCKLPSLLAAADELGCESVATGHYARIAQLADNGRYVVKCALDARKDQSYMLALLSQEQLARLVLPLGGTTKAEVRVLAADLGLPVAEKPESQDVCFIEGDYRAFLRARGVDDRPGAIVDCAGAVLGRHDGLANYTVGQRKGIGVAAPEPYYVVAKRPETSELVVGFADEARISSVLTGPVRWQALACLDGPRAASVKLRYRSRAVPCIIEPEPEGRVRAVLREPQPTTAPGQFAVFSVGDTVLGGGMIEEVASV